MQAVPGLSALSTISISPCEVDVAPAEAVQLAGAEPGEQTEHQQRAVARRQRVVAGGGVQEGRIWGSVRQWGCHTLQTRHSESTQ